MSRRIEIRVVRRIERALGHRLVARRPHESLVLADGHLVLVDPEPIHGYRVRRPLLGVDKSLADTCLGMLRYGLMQRVGRGRYVVP